MYYLKPKTPEEILIWKEEKLEIVKRTRIAMVERVRTQKPTDKPQIGADTFMDLDARKEKLEKKIASYKEYLDRLQKFHNQPNNGFNR